MPILSRWFIKSGMLFFIFSLTLAVLIKSQPLLAFGNVLPFFIPVFYHTLMVGWITQIIFGISIWMFPRDSKVRPRGHLSLGWMAFFALNSGLILRIFCEPLNVIRPQPIWLVLLVLSAGCQWLSGILFVILIWKRVKEK